MSKHSRIDKKRKFISKVPFTQKDKNDKAVSRHIKKQYIRHMKQEHLNKKNRERRT